MKNPTLRLAHDSSSKESFAGLSLSLRSSPLTENLPQGVSLRSLQTHHDERGSLTELFRASWDIGIDAVQWNYCESEANVLRGVHMHVKHADYLILLRGRASIGLRDLRPGSPTEGLTALVTLARQPISGPNQSSYSAPLTGLPAEYSVHQRSSPSGVLMASNTRSASALMGKS